MDDDLVAAGRYARIQTTGRSSGDLRSVTVGFVEDDAGPPDSLLVAAGQADADWATNLLVDRACVVTVGERSFAALAEPLDGPHHARAVRALILRYGTSAEGLGRGPSFRLVPA